MKKFFALLTLLSCTALIGADLESIMFDSATGVVQDPETAANIDLPADTTIGGSTPSTSAGVEFLIHKIIDADSNMIINIGNEEVKAGIDAAKLADGSVSNTEYQYIGTVTSNVQDQIDGKAATSHSHTLSDVTDAGTSASLNVPASGDAAAGEVVKGNDTRLADPRTPTAHANSHTDGTDDIQDATASQKGLMTAAQAAKLDGIGNTYSFSFVIPTDPDNDNLHFNVDIASDSAFSTILHSADTTSSRTGCYMFSGSQWGAYPDVGAASTDYGSTAGFTFSSGTVTRGTLYFVRVRVHDGTAWTDYTGDLKTW